MNSSRTWKSGERCGVTGTYRCQNCAAAGRETVRNFAQGTILPMCDQSPDSDVTWRLLEAGGKSAATA